MKNLKSFVLLMFLLLAAGAIMSCKKKDKSGPTDTCGIPDLQLTASVDVSNPCGLAVSASGKVAITEYKQPYGSTGITKVWNSYSDLLAKKAPAQSFQSVGAEAIAFDNNENLYITETEQNARIVIYKMATVNGVKTYQYLRVIQEGFVNPRGIAFDSKNRLYLADDGKDRLLRFNDPLNSSSMSVVAGVFGSPKGLAIANDTLYLTGYSSDRLYKYGLTAAGGLGKSVVVSLPKLVDVATYGNIVAGASPGNKRITLLNSNQIQTSEVTYSGCTKTLSGTGDIYGLAFVKTTTGYGLLAAHYNQNKILFYQP
ncbi:hypothetical protein EZ456_04070 [Pedobacter psychrodurus]|uniref:SMP-30/Gluconolactonase/LRE-like region domain-containing protein n=1 Tax=Pedobacter psychrodurus TaxID=2530456 RepID=A0A4R0Q9K1_9SPHI|nr:hypothetical protein [Pedobacter psychrodurus]TCD28574.1 hypothetical protein EZ456_04070 [Pedobacter psychrodurus]